MRNRYRAQRSNAASESSIRGRTAAGAAIGLENFLGMARRLEAFEKPVAIDQSIATAQPDDVGKESAL